MVFVFLMFVVLAVFACCGLSCCLIGLFPEFEVKFCLMDLRSTKRCADESKFDFDGPK
jgi:hypothetical protein